MSEDPYALGMALVELMGGAGLYRLRCIRITDFADRGEPRRETFTEERDRSYTYTELWVNPADWSDLLTLRTRDDADFVFELEERDGVQHLKQVARMASPRFPVLHGEGPSTPFSTLG